MRFKTSYKTFIIIDSEENCGQASKDWQIPAEMFMYLGIKYNAYALSLWL